MTSTNDPLTERYGDSYKWLATITVMTGTLSVALSTTVINVAIPDVMAAFGIPQSKAHWLSTGFLAAMPAFMLVSAWAAHVLGMRLAYAGSLAVFVLASVVGALSPNEDVMILARVAQGAMAGTVQPMALSLIFRVFPAHQRGLGVGLYGLGAMLGPAAGPVLGGFLVDLFDWRAVFILSIPTCLITIVLTLLYAPGREPGRVFQRFDGIGFGLLCVFVTSLLWVLSSGQRLGWDTLLIRGLLVTTVVSAVAFVIWELRVRHPLLNPRLLTSTGFSASCVLAFFFGAGMFGSTYLIPLFVQEIHGYTATTAGLLLLPAGLVMAFIFPLSGHLCDRLSPSVPIGAGTLLFALSCYGLSLADADTVLWVLLAWVALGRLGMGLGFPPINVGGLRTLDYGQVNAGVGAISFARQIGGALGVNLLSLSLDFRALHHADIAPEAQSEGVVEVLGRMVDLQAYARGFQDSFLLLALTFLLAMVPVWIVGRSSGVSYVPPRADPEEPGAKG